MSDVVPMPGSRAVRAAGPAADLISEAASVAGSLSAALTFIVRHASECPLPGGGFTHERWQWLSTVAAADLTAARVAEAHLDAVAILHEAGLAARANNGVTWGVYAAEGPGLRVDAHEDPGGGADGWRLSGDKPWCSAAGALDRALITAHTPTGRRLFAIDLTSPTVTTLPSVWVSRGLADVDSTGIRLDETPATAVGETGWYLDRPGFAWGGMGVAACWYGGLVGLARRLWRTATAREPDQVARVHLGAVDLQVQRCAQLLKAAASAVDAGEATGEAGQIWAERVRGTVADAVEVVLAAVGHGIGPGPLTAEEEHARRVADLTVYIRQHHAERDQARLGSLLLQQDRPPWG